jgi:hypothetical protein
MKKVVLAELDRTPVQILSLLHEEAEADDYEKL